MRAVFVDCTSELKSVLHRRQLTILDNVRVNLGSPTAAELVELCTGMDAIFVEHTVVPPAVSDACPSIRAVVFMGTGAGTYIDMEDAAWRGIGVATTPGYGDRARRAYARAEVRGISFGHPNEPRSLCRDSLDAGSAVTAIRAVVDPTDSSRR